MSLIPRTMMAGEKRRPGFPAAPSRYSANELSQLCGLSAICELARTFLREQGIRSQESGATPGELAAVLERTAEVLRTRYGSSLTVISWNVGDPVVSETEKVLLTRG